MFASQEWISYSSLCALRGRSSVMGTCLSSLLAKTWIWTWILCHKTTKQQVLPQQIQTCMLKWGPSHPLPTPTLGPATGTYPFDLHVGAQGCPIYFGDQEVAADLGLQMAAQRERFPNADCTKSRRKSSFTLIYRLRCFHMKHGCWSGKRKFISLQIIMQRVGIPLM